MRFALPFLAALGAGFAAALVLTPLARWTARCLGIVDAPDRGLKTHRRATPYLGGAAIFLSVVLATVLVKLFFFHTLHGVLAILTGGSIVFLLGLTDDLFRLSPGVKLFGQTIAALILILFGIKIQFLFLTPLAVAVTLIWVVGVTNAFNLVDVADGLAAGTALLAAVTFGVIGFETHLVNNVILAASLAGALAAFLIYNVRPASIFMGDAGALFIGFILAAISMGESYSRVNQVAVVCPLLILAVPLFETMLVSVIRLGRGMSPLLGSRDHLVHRLTQAGLSPGTSAGVLWAASALLCVLAYLSIHVRLELVFLIYAGVGFSAIVFSIWIASIRMEIGQVKSKK